MSDSSDSLSADLFELELRNLANRDHSRSWELIWFLRLPPDVRCSYTRILEARIDQDKYRNYLRRQSAYQHQNWRKPQSRNEGFCFQIHPVNPWGSIRRREHQRKPRSALRSFGRRRDPRPGVRFAPDPPYFKAVSPVVAPPAPPVDPDSVPERPSTPPGLRDSIYLDTELTYEAGGLDPATGNRRYSYTPPIPATPSPIPSPELTPPVPQHPTYAPGPLFPRGGRFMMIQDSLVPTDLAFIIAAGRAHRSPWAHEESKMRAVGLDMFDFELQSPGVLDALSALLFPSGLDDLTLAIPVNHILLDFVLGWSILPYARSIGQMPEPWQACPCGEGVIPA